MISGGIINDWGSNARLGKGEWMIVEADESDGTFVRLPTQIGIVTNIDPEHLDHFGTVENMHREYETFYRNIPFYGLAVTCIDHPVVREMVERLELRRDGRRLLTYGTSPGADLVLRGLTHERGAIVIDAELGARVRGGERRIRGWRIPVLGEHNALNALAAIAAAAEAGIPDDAIAKSLVKLQGRQAALRADRHVERRRHLRRLRASPDRDRRGAGGGARRRSRAAHRRVRAAPLQPRARPLRRVLRLLPRRRQRHRGAALFGRRAADRRASITTTWPRASGPRGIPPRIAIDDPRDLVPLLRRILRPGDTVVCLGAGTSTEWAHALPDWLGAEEPRRAGGAL